MSAEATDEEMLEFRMRFWTFLISGMKTKFRDLIMMDLGWNTNGSIDSWDIQATEDAIKFHLSLGSVINDRICLSITCVPIDDDENKKNIFNQLEINAGTNYLDEEPDSAIESIFNFGVWHTRWNVN